MTKQSHFSPWGWTHDIEQIADGIEFYTTDSHGGYKLSPERIAAMPEHLRLGVWYEEDCNWARVCLAFPEVFPIEALEAAKRTYQWQIEWQARKSA